MVSKHRDREDGAERVIVKRGQPVNFRAEAQVPYGAGEIVSFEWDFEGDGTYAIDESLRKHRRPSATASAESTHAFSRRGTSFVGVRVAAQSAATEGTPFGRVENLARVRVIVE
jgi:hypothetical protein